MSEKEYIEVEVDEETFKELDKMRKRKPNGTMESIDDVLTRLLDNVERGDE